MGKTFELARLIIKYHIGIVIILKLLFYSLPYFLSYILPISALLSTLLTFLRLTQDKEYIAIKAAGISPKGFLAFLSFFATFCFFITLFTTSTIFPLGYRASKKLVFSLAQKKIEIALKPGVFTNLLPDIIFYVDRIEDGKLKGIFLYDARNKNNIYQNQLIIAKSGFIAQEKDKIVFHLKDGYILKNKKDSPKLASYFLTYKKYIFVIQAPSKIAKRWRNPKEYYLWQLWKRIRQKEKDIGFILAFHHNVSLPVTAFIFVFLGAVLGLREEKRKHLGAVFWGIVWLTIYQALFLAGKTLAKIHVISPHISLWISDIIIATITLIFWYKIIHE